MLLKKLTQNFVSFVDRDMMMRHFGTGIGHVDYPQNENDEGVSDPGSDMADLEDSLSQHDTSENMENIGGDLDDAEPDSDSDSDSHSDTSSSGSGSDESSDSDDNGYASF